MGVSKVLAAHLPEREGLSKKANLQTSFERTMGRNFNLQKL